jgi:hypothetical protein
MSLIFLANLDLSSQGLKSVGPRFIFLANLDLSSQGLKSCGKATTGDNECCTRVLRVLGRAQQRHSCPTAKHSSPATTKVQRVGSGLHTVPGWALTCYISLGFHFRSQSWPPPFCPTLPLLPLPLPAYPVFCQAMYNTIDEMSSTK